VLRSFVDSLSCRTINIVELKNRRPKDGRTGNRRTKRSPTKIVELILEIVELKIAELTDRRTKNCQTGNCRTELKYLEAFTFSQIL
jgi:hypothetical protein